MENLPDFRRDAVHPHWVVIDTRRASEKDNSGIARFISGLSRSLAEVLASSNQSSKNSTTTKILLISKHEPPTWAVELVHKFPTVVSFWSGGPGALTRKWEKPVYGWSTFVFKRVAQLTHDRFVWLAPANFDRPLLFFGLRFGKSRNRIVQIIHDTIPFQQEKSMGLFFRIQFKLLVKRTLSLFPNIITVSHYSTQQLKSVCPKRKSPIAVVPVGVDANFGKHHRPATIEEKREARMRLSVKVLGAQFFKSMPVEEFVRAKWVLGVGREQKYKCWDLAENVVAKCAAALPEKAILFRLGGQKSDGAKSGDTRAGTDKNFCVSVAELSDGDLAEFYRLADLLLHPSLAEGFGLPPIEAALSGLPVIFKTGNAVEEHFSQGILPVQFWKPMVSQSEEDWFRESLSLLQNPDSLARFFEKMSHANSPREYISKLGGGNSFDWQQSGQQLHKFLQESFFIPQEGDVK